MAEKAADVVDLLVKASTFFATPTYAGRMNVMELRLTTFKTAMHNSANFVCVICVQQQQPQNL